MLNRKLLEILQRLSVAEKNRLRQFLCSPYFNASGKASALIDLFDLIVQYDADEDAPELHKAVVFKMFFPDRQFEEKAKGPLDSLTTDLLGLTRRFLVQQEHDKNYSEVQEQLVMARFYRRFALEDRFWQSIQHARKLQNEVSTRDAAFYFDQMQVEEEEVNYRSQYNSFDDDANLLAIQENLDKYYSILKLECICAFVYQNQFTALDKEPPQILREAVLTLAQEGGMLDLPANRIYQLILLLIQQPNNDAVFAEFEMLTEQYAQHFSSDKYKDVMAYKRFFLIKRYFFANKDNINQRILTLHKEHLERGYFYTDNTINLNAFYNLTVFALRVGDYEWAKHFLDTHPPERIFGTRYPQEMHNLCRAEYFFATNQFEQADQTLVYRHYENSMVSILTDVLLLKIYYETHNELLDNRLKALDQKVRRTKLAPQKKEEFLNFIRKLDKLHRHREPAKRAKIAEEIKTIPGIISRDWLLAKALS